MSAQHPTAEPDYRSRRSWTPTPTVSMPASAPRTGPWQTGCASSPRRCSRRCARPGTRQSTPWPWSADGSARPTARRRSRGGHAEGVCVAAGLATMEMARGDGSGHRDRRAGRAGHALHPACGSEEQAEYLPPMARGELLGAFALTEPTHGSDAVGLETTADRTEGGWVINGHKKWIGNGSAGGITVVWPAPPKIRRSAGSSSPRSPGVQRQPDPGQGLPRAIHQADIEFRDVFVPGRTCCRRPPLSGTPPGLLFSTRVGVAWSAVGLALGCFETALQYQQRQRFGRPLAASQIVQERLARMLSELTQVQLLVLRAAAGGARGSSPAPRPRWPILRHPRRTLDRPERP